MSNAMLQKLELYGHNIHSITVPEPDTDYVVHINCYDTHSVKAATMAIPVASHKRRDDGWIEITPEVVGDAPITAVNHMIQIPAGHDIEQVDLVLFDQKATKLTTQPAGKLQAVNFNTTLSRNAVSVLIPQVVVFPPPPPF